MAAMNNLSSAESGNSAPPAKKGEIQRGPNFHTDEKLLLEELVKENFDIITSKLTNTATNQMKNEVWETIGREISALDFAKRSGSDVKNKWANMKRGAKDAVTKEKLERRKTGGGVCSVEVSDQEERIAGLYAESASFVGIPGGMDSDEPDGQNFLSNKDALGSSKVSDADHHDRLAEVSTACRIKDVCLSSSCTGLLTEKASPSCLMDRPDSAAKSAPKRVIHGKVISGKSVKRSRHDMLVDYQIRYFKGQVEKQALEKELPEVNLRILKAAESKLDELTARDMLYMLGEQ